MDGDPSGSYWRDSQERRLEHDPEGRERRKCRACEGESAWHLQVRGGGADEGEESRDTARRFLTYGAEQKMVSLSNVENGRARVGWGGDGMSVVRTCEFEMLQGTQVEKSRKQQIEMHS